MARYVRMISGAPASLSKNACIGFAEFNELNEGLNQWLSGKKDGAFAGNIWRFDLTNVPVFYEKKQDIIERSLSSGRGGSTTCIQLRATGGGSATCQCRHDGQAVSDQMR